MQSVRHVFVLALAAIAAVFVLSVRPQPVGAQQANVPCYFDQGGALFHVGSGCTAQIESGGILNVVAGGLIQFGGVSTSLAKAVQSTTAAQKIIGGQATTATASDTVVTGLAVVTSCSAVLDAGPVADPE